MSLYTPPSLSSAVISSVEQPKSSKPITLYPENTYTVLCTNVVVEERNFASAQEREQGIDKISCELAIEVVNLDAGWHYEGIPTPTRQPQLVLGNFPLGTKVLFRSVYDLGKLYREPKPGKELSKNQKFVYGVMGDASEASQAQLFETNAMIGRQLIITVAHSVSADGKNTYQRITDIQFVPESDRLDDSWVDRSEDGSEIARGIEEGWLVQWDFVKRPIIDLQVQSLIPNSDYVVLHTDLKDKIDNESVLKDLGFELRFMSLRNSQIVKKVMVLPKDDNGEYPTGYEKNIAKAQKLGYAFMTPAELTEFAVSRDYVSHFTFVSNFVKTRMPELVKKGMVPDYMVNPKFAERKNVSVVDSKPAPAKAPANKPAAEEYGFDVSELPEVDLDAMVA